MTTPDTEEKKVQWREVPKQVGVTLNIGDKYTYVETRLSPEEMQGIKELIEYSLTSRDTYWKERVRKDYQALKETPAYVNLVTQWGQLDEDGICIGVSRQALEETMTALDTLLDNLK